MKRHPYPPPPSVHLRSSRGRRLRSGWHLWGLAFRVCVLHVLGGVCAFVCRRTRRCWRKRGCWHTRYGLCAGLQRCWAAYWHNTPTPMLTPTPTPTHICKCTHTHQPQNVGGHVSVWITPNNSPTTPAQVSYPHAPPPPPNKTQPLGHR